MSWPTLRGETTVCAIHYADRLGSCVFQYDLAKTTCMTSAVHLQIGTTERGLPKSCRCWQKFVNLFDVVAYPLYKSGQ